MEASGALFSGYTFFNASIVSFLDPHKDDRLRLKTPISVLKFLHVDKKFLMRLFLPFITDCRSSSISWYYYNRICAYSADHGSIQTTPRRTQVRLNSSYSNDARLVPKLRILLNIKNVKELNLGARESTVTGTVQTVY